MKNLRTVCLLIPLLAVHLASDARAGGPRTAWVRLVAQHPTLAAKVPALEREILRSLTPEEAYAFASGTPASEILLSTGETLETLFLRKGIDPFDVFWYSMDTGGGTTMTGGEFSLTGTVGQADAGVMTGGPFTLTGGFWAPFPGEPCESSEAIFCDGFESGDTSSWL